MKRLILFELIILFLATTFESDSPPGWFQQNIPVNKIINDIFFIDSSNGWAVTAGGSSASDTAFILNTTNGGTNWLIQKTGIEQLDAVQFIDNNTGYAVGKLFLTTFLSIYKTTNSGINWTGLNNISGLGPTDIYFVNKDTGWIAASENSTGGLYKTTNGGLNWSQQLSGSFGPSKLFFINKDTGWAACQNTNLYRTTNGGGVWTLQFTSEYTIESLYFLDKFKGWMRGGYIANTMGVAYTTDGGFSWTNAQGEVGGFDIKFVNDSIGYSGMINNKITKSRDGGKIWGYQTSPVYSNLSTVMFKSDTLNGWAGGTGIVHTTDGGGSLILGITQTSTETPSEYKLYQNYPNPFNPVTNIKYSIMPNVKSQMSKVLLSVFDVTGKEVAILVNTKQNTGTYLADWNASGFASGIYFYSLLIDGKAIDTRRMVLVK